MKSLVSALLALLVEKVISFTSVLFSVRAAPIHTALLRLRGVIVKGPVFVGRRVLVTNPSKLHLGARVGIGNNAVIACTEKISIGDDFLAAPGLYLNSGGHDTSTLEAFGQPIVIGQRVWCGVRVTILAGVEIGDDVVIGAGSIVTQSIPTRSIAVGVPAKVVGTVHRDLANFRSWFKP